MEYLVWTVGSVAGLYLLHRAALFAEQRGWIYYRRMGERRGALGNALLEVQALVEPSQTHVLVERKKDATVKGDPGEPPEDE